MWDYCHIIWTEMWDYAILLHIAFELFFSKDASQRVASFNQIDNQSDNFVRRSVVFCFMQWINFLAKFDTR